MPPERIGEIKKVWNKACREAGLGYGYKTDAKYIKEWEEKGLTSGPIFHDLRRSAIREMVRSGYSERVAMEISGHRTRSVFDRYNIVDLEDQKAAAARRVEKISSSYK